MGEVVLSIKLMVALSNEVVPIVWFVLPLVQSIVLLVGMIVGGGIVLDQVVDKFCSIKSYNKVLLHGEDKDIDLSFE